MTAKGKLKTILIFAVIAALLFAAFAGSYRTVMELSYPHKYEEFVEKYSAEFGLTAPCSMPLSGRKAPSTPPPSPRLTPWA